MRYRDYTRVFIALLSVFLIIIVAFFLKTKSIDEKNQKSYSLLENVYKIELLYHEIKSTISNGLLYLNYDTINDKIAECDRLIGKLEGSKELLMLPNSQYRFDRLVSSLREDFLKKREAIEDFKSLNAVAANSARYLKSEHQIYKNPKWDYTQV